MGFQCLSYRFNFRSICILKSSLIPASVIVFAVSYLAYFISSNTKLKVVGEFGLATVLVGYFSYVQLFLSINLQVLYCILFWEKAITPPPTALLSNQVRHSWELLKQPSEHSEGLRFFILILLGCLSLSIRPLKFANLPAESLFSNRQAPLSMTVAALVATVVVGVLTENADPFRYSFSHLFPAIIILIMLAMTDTGGLNKNGIPNFFIVAVFCAGLAISYNWDITKNTYSAYVKNIKFGLTNPSLVSAKQNLQYGALQQSIPQGETVLTRLDAPFILDFKRNQLFLADSQGGASLPPGMPAFKKHGSLGKLFKLQIYSIHRLFVLESQSSPKCRYFRTWIVILVSTAITTLSRLSG